MKKLAFVAAAALAGACFADGIASANVVGYASTDAKNGKGIGINFVNVSGEATKLSDLKVTGYELEDGDFLGIITLQALDAYGRVKEEGGKVLEYQWLDCAGEGYPAGWYLGEDPAGDTPLAIGDGLWLQSDTPTCQIQCAGQVYAQQLPIILPSNVGMLCANPCPCDITFNKITISGYELVGNEFWGVVSAQKLDEYGRVKEEGGVVYEYMWLDCENEGYTAGWYLGEDAAGSTKLDMGDALWVQTDDLFTYTLTFPTAL